MQALATSGQRPFLQNSRVLQNLDANTQIIQGDLVANGFLGTVSPTILSLGIASVSTLQHVSPVSVAPRNTLNTVIVRTSECMQNVYQKLAGIWEVL